MPVDSGVKNLYSRNNHVKNRRNAMNLGAGEILIVIINGLLVLGIPLILSLVFYSLIRRLRGLESRVEKLEAAQDGNPEKKL
jgi:Sec-independent protein translocase protein TatA